MCIHVCVCKPSTYVCLGYMSCLFLGPATVSSYGVLCPVPCLFVDSLAIVLSSMPKGCTRRNYNMNLCPNKSEVFPGDMA